MKLSTLLMAMASTLFASSAVQAACTPNSVVVCGSTGVRCDTPDECCGATGLC